MLSLFLVVYSETGREPKLARVACQPYEEDDLARGDTYGCMPCGEREGRRGGIGGQDGSYQDEIGSIHTDRIRSYP
jgi:hypothetical protein